MGLISRVSSRTYRNMTDFYLLSLFCTAILAQFDDVVIQRQVDNVCDHPSRKGDFLGINYVASMADTLKVFSDSRTRSDKPYRMWLGDPVDPIIGLSEGLYDMCEGDRRRLIIPEHKAYGRIDDHDDYTNESVVIFEVELVYIDRRH